MAFYLTPVFTWISDKLLAPAVVAVFFTGITNLMIERRKATRDLVTKLADTLRDDLRSLQGTAVEYWARPRRKGDEIVEARITAAQTDILRSLAILEEMQVAICDPDDDPRPELLDSLTGGDFGSAQRAADPSRVVRVSQAAGELRERVLRRRANRLRKNGL